MSILGQIVSEIVAQLFLENSIRIYPSKFFWVDPKRDAYLTAEVKYSSRKALKTAQDGVKNMTHDSVNIFFKLLLKNFL